MANTGVVLLDSKTGRKIVSKHCKKNDISIQMIEDLVQAELEQVGKHRKRGLKDRFDEILSQEYED